jgi:hypothetical protein
VAQECYKARVRSVWRSFHASHDGISENEPFHLISVIRRPLSRVFIMSGLCMQLDVLPKFRFSFSRERPGATFHSGIVAATV